VKVRFTPAAAEQLLRAVQRIKDDNPLPAVRFGARIKRTLRRLGPHPQSGRRIPEFPDLPFRKVVVPPLRFFYRVENSVVWIVDVWHSAQDPRSPGAHTGG
jgi:plasmid stabilization system protein ParE